jgi:hypothetical protein
MNKRLLLSLTSILWLSACSSPGSTEPKVTGDAGSAGSAGEPAAGAGGSTAAGSGGASAGGSSGTAGAASGGVAAAGSAGAREPSNSGRDLVSDDVLANAAMIHMSCWGDDGAWRTTRAFRQANVTGGWWDGNDEVTRCLADVTGGCAEADACLGITLATEGVDTAVCGTCDGELAYLCRGDVYSWDCSAWGKTCSDGGCIDVGDVCEDDTRFEACETDASVVECRDVGRLNTRTDCAGAGLTCITDPPEDFNLATCGGDGAACTRPTSEEDYFKIPEVGQLCEGAFLHGCYGGREGAIDCSSMGPDYTCQYNGGVAFCGTAADCNPRTHGKVCNGDFVEICVGGKRYEWDCAALNLNTCMDDSRYSWAACDGRGRSSP